MAESSHQGARQAGDAVAPTPAQPSLHSRSKSKQRSGSSNEGVSSGSGNDAGGASSRTNAQASSSFANPDAADSSLAFTATGADDTSIRSGGPGAGGEEKKTRKQVQNRTAQRRYRGRQAEYVKQLETEIELLKASPEFRESAKDEWIRRLQEDNRQLKAFILGPHRITLTESVDVLLRKSYAIEDGVLQPFISSPVVEAAAILPENGAANSGAGQASSGGNALGISNSLLDDGSSGAHQIENLISKEHFANAANSSSNTSTTRTSGQSESRNHNASNLSNIAPGNLFLNSSQAMPPAEPTSFGASGSAPNQPSETAPQLDQYSLRLPTSAAQPPHADSFAAGMSHFLSSSAMASSLGIPWHDPSTSAGQQGQGAAGLSRPDQGFNGGNSMPGPNSTSTFQAPQPHLAQRYPTLSGSSLAHAAAQYQAQAQSHHQHASSSAGGLVGNRNNSDDTSSGAGNGDGASGVGPFSSADGPPLAQKRRVGGYLGMSHEPSNNSGLPGGPSGGTDGPHPIHVLPAQLYAQREQLSAMIRHVFEAPGMGPVDFSSPDFSYEPYQHRLEPIFRFCWSWAMAIWPDEPEMEVAAMAWIIFLFSNAAVNFYLKLPDFLQPTREQQSLPHEAAVMFVPWKELRNQMVLLDGFVNFRIVGELVNCTCLQAGQYKPNAGPLSTPKPARSYGPMRHIKELTFFDESFIPFEHLIDIDNWRLSRDAISRFPQLDIPERLIEAGDVRKRKEQAWAAQKRGGIAGVPQA